MKREMVEEALGYNSMIDEYLHSTKNVHPVSHNTQTKKKPQENRGTKSQAGYLPLTHRNFIMSRFQKIT